MTTHQELYHLQSSLTMIFDRIGITQEIQDDLSLSELTHQEQDQLALLIEKYEHNLKEIRSSLSSIDEALDQRLLIRLGNYYYNSGDNSRALEYYGLSNLVEENEWGYFNSARILQSQKELGSAFEKYEQAIKLKPDFPQAFRHQAEILILQGDKETALKKLEKSQQLNPNDPETNKLLAEHYISQGDQKKALTHLKAIHYRDPDVLEKIEELEQKKSILNRIFGRFRNR